MLEFKTIDLVHHRDTCVQFRRDSYACSFADGKQRFDKENGTDGSGYIEWLGKRLAEFPQGCVHVWNQSVIIGQIESRLREDRSGYVNLFYLEPGSRGRGLGRELHEYAVDLFASLNVQIVRLTVSEENENAMRFYRCLGWKEVGPRPGRNDSRVFAYTVTEAFNR